MSRFKVGEKCKLGKDLIEIIDVWKKDKVTLEQRYTFRYLDEKKNSKTFNYCCTERDIERIVGEK